MSHTTIQVVIFLFITAAIGLLTYLKVSSSKKASTTDSTREYFLAGGGLSWVFVAGSITLTNLSTEQLVGMNGAQMLLLAWWEFAAVIGLIILAKVFLPIYYKEQCLTTTELLEKRYGGKSVRSVIAFLFLLGNVFIFLPSVLYTGSLFITSMFSVNISLIVCAAIFGFVGAAYAIFGGLRAVAVSDTYSGALLLSMGLAVVYFSLKAIDFSFEGVPLERLTLIGDSDSPIPWHTLFTGMVFIQIFYWSTNQTITQRAMASPTLKEAQKGVFAAAGIRLLIVPPLIVIPGVVAYKLYGGIGDAAYGTIVNDVLPAWMSGAFAAAIAAAVLTSFNSILNASAALYVCDFHENFINKEPNVPKLNAIVTLFFVLISIALVPMYAKSQSIIALIQQLYGLLSMPILSTFIVGLVFDKIKPASAIVAVISGVIIYYVFTFAYPWAHYIHMMFVTLVSCIFISMAVNRFLFNIPIEFNVKLLHLLASKAT